MMIAGFDLRAESNYKLKSQQLNDQLKAYHGELAKRYGTPGIPGAFGCGSSAWRRCMDWRGPGGMKDKRPRLHISLQDHRMEVPPGSLFGLNLTIPALLNVALPRLLSQLPW